MMPENENFGTTPSFGITTNRGYRRRRGEGGFPRCRSGTCRAAAPRQFLCSSFLRSSFSSRTARNARLTGERAAALAGEHGPDDREAVLLPLPGDVQRGHVLPGVPGNRLRLRVLRAVLGQRVQGPYPSPSRGAGANHTPPGTPPGGSRYGSPGPLFRGRGLIAEDPSCESPAAPCGASHVPRGRHLLGIPPL